MAGTIRDNIGHVRTRIAEAARRSGRPPERVRLMAVTKTVDDDRIREAIACGVDIVGENYVQEAQRKLAIMGKSLEWHLVGHLQTNKAKVAVRLFDLIHSVDRPELAREINRRAAAAGVSARVLLEVNLSGEATKSGIPREGAFELLQETLRMDHLAVRGLMTMPPWFADPEGARPYFSALRELRDAFLQEGFPAAALEELSMGMSDDYAVAVEEGATIVRIGRAIFGERPPRRG